MTLLLKTFSLYIINRKIHGCLEIRNLFLVLKMISHSFAALTREISYSTLEINFVFPRTHVLFSISMIIGTHTKLRVRSPAKVILLRKQLLQHHITLLTNLRNDSEHCKNIVSPKLTKLQRTKQLNEAVRQYQSQTSCLIDIL